MKSLNGHIMSKDTVVATVENGSITSFDQSRIPLHLKNKNDVEGWLLSRAIDSHRVNSRLLKKVLRLSACDEVETVIAVNGATITDTYWFKKMGSELCYNDIRYKENLFDKLALRGDPDSFSYKPSRTPELTNTGSFEKCWRLIDGEWWLYKNGNDMEYFSELFICRLGEMLGFDMAYYEMSEDGYIRSRDFTNGASVNFEPMDGIMGSNEDYEANFTKLISISDELAKQYLKMIYLDTLCYNMDRHTKNYGLLRDVKTGDILSLAPNFDNNIALISRGYPSDVSREHDGIIRFFEEFLAKNQTAKEMYIKMDLQTIDDQMIGKCLDSVPISADRDYVNSFILNGQVIIQTILGPEISQDFTQKM